MLKTESKQIGEYTYKVMQLDAVRARAAFLRLAQLVAPAFEKAVGVEGGIATAAPEKVFGAIAKVIQNVKTEDLDYFCDVFGPTTCVVIHDGGKTREPKLSTIMSLHFAGDDLVYLFEWLYFCFEVNFGSFFAKLGVLRGSSGAPTTESK